MALVVVNGGEADMLANALNKTAPENLTLILFTNNVTPGETSVIGDLTEATGSGYSAVALTASNWTITPGAPTEAAYPEVTFTFSGALGNVYGYALKGSTSGNLKWAERFSNGPYNIQNNGDQIKITPKITLE